MRNRKNKGGNPGLVWTDRKAGQEKHKRLTKKQKKIILTIFGILLIGASCFFLYKHFQTPPPEVPISQPTNKIKAEPGQKLYSKLTGLEVTEAQANRSLTALIIENSVDARPQSGLDKAGVVFEAIAEGGITRFATIYQEENPSEIGPVRSLRPYYLDWLRPFNPTIAHVGGSKKALSLVRDGSWRDMDQFANGKSFWRSKERKAPHNVYTSFELVDKYNQTKNYELDDFKTIPRKEDQKSSAPTATEIKMNISSKLYNSTFTYNPEKNDYLRSQGGAPHLDKSGTQLEPKVVVALISPHSIINEADGARYTYQTIGSGEAVIFQDGTATPVTWSKPDQKSQILLKDANGVEVKLNRGQTWFTALGTRNKLVY